MTRKDHIQKHKELHAYLDMLIADYISHNEIPISELKVMDLVAWSYNQTIDPEE